MSEASAREAALAGSRPGWAAFLAPPHDDLRRGSGGSQGPFVDKRKRARRALTQEFPAARCAKLRPTDSAQCLNGGIKRRAAIVGGSANRGRLARSRQPRRIKDGRAVQRARTIAQRNFGLSSDDPIVGLPGVAAWLAPSIPAKKRNALSPPLGVWARALAAICSSRPRSVRGKDSAPWARLIDFCRFAIDKYRPTTESGARSKSAALLRRKKSSADALRTLAKQAKDFDQSVRSGRCAAMVCSPMRFDRFTVRSFRYARLPLHPEGSTEGRSMTALRVDDPRKAWRRAAPSRSEGLG